MTVRRHSDDYFDAAPAAVASAVRVVLARRPPYIRADEVEKDAIFKARVRPRRWLLGTDLTIRLKPSSGGTQVTASTKSQWFIMGDVLGCYDGYIRDFLRNLGSQLQKRPA
jgi:hypothetical protein